MINNKYEIIIYWDDQDKIYIAEGPELPGCMAHGKTENSALKSLKKAMDLWIETAKSYGDPIPQPKGRKLMLA